MGPLRILQEASTLIHQNVASLAGTKSAGGDFGRGAGGDISKNIDIVAERTVLDYLQDVQFPCTVLGEECGRVDITGNPKGYVIMDAIDGTANAVRGFPFYCSSLAFAEEYTMGSVTAGVVKNLYSGQTFWASKGEGSFMDGTPIRAGRGDAGYNIIGINVSGATPDLLKKVQPLMGVGHIRHMGANALEMALFAQGLLDAFVDIRGKIRVQDMAAGYLLARESGGVLLDEAFKELDADLGYGTRLSFVAAADMEMANFIAVNIGMAPLAGFEHASQP